MGTFNVAELRPGMVLAEDLRNPLGRFLLARGTKLEAKHLRVLKMWGVVEVNIEGVSQKDVEADIMAKLDPEIIEEAEKTVSDRFCCADLEYPPIRELFRICSLRKAEEISDVIEKEDRDSY